ncbi:hypothetical protein SDC9_151134 [bioreactor metagenome]|uniref:Uncharacterized protein n=1 Tax=bioreactor metagenome TaxID=1076179 RepID=A0A645ERU7_9ZZZZ
MQYISLGKSSAYFGMYPKTLQMNIDMIKITIYDPVSDISSINDNFVPIFFTLIRNTNKANNNVAIVKKSLIRIPLPLTALKWAERLLYNFAYKLFDIVSS